jgi:hypothetical protein
LGEHAPLVNSEICNILPLQETYNEGALMMQ